jgi:hypothetical protein
MRHLFNNFIFTLLIFSLASYTLASAVGKWLDVLRKWKDRNSPYEK